MTEKRFTYGLRKGTAQYEIKDSLHEFPIVEPFYYESYAKKVCGFLNELYDENEQLKHYKEAYGDEIVNIKTTIKTMMENERTEIGKNVLRQLWEAIE